MRDSRSALIVFFFTCFVNSTDSEDTKAKPEDDVILHCRDPSNATILLLRWIRPDLVSEGYVYFFRERHSYNQYQHPTFHGRVELRDPEMKDGDVSVILKRFSISDTGTYECHAGRNDTGSGPEIINIIHLKVEAVQENITAEPGDDVTLPCQVPTNSQILVVVWIRPDLDPEYVFMYKNGQSDPDHQHPTFKSRVELKDSGIKDGNLSLILKNVMINDNGIYECHVYQSERNHTMSIVSLDVHHKDIRAKPGDNVTLQCRGPSEGVIELLEWSKPDLKSEDHVYYYRDERSYENYQHPSFLGRVELRDPQMEDGDASLILKNVNINDTGTYECYVGFRRRSELINKIILTVRDSGGGAGRTEDGGNKDGHVGLVVGLSVVSVLLLVAVVVGLLILRKPKDQNSYNPPPEQTCDTHV